MLGLLDLRERGERLEPSRFESDPTVTETVRGILERVRAHGDAVLIDLAERFDGADLSATGLVATDVEFDRAASETPEALRTALDALILRLQDLHRRQLPAEWWDERDGVRSGEVVRPLAGVGCYVPGGRAVYPSSVCMTVVPAVVAGVERIVLCTPPQPDGSIPAAVLYAARKAGATMVVKSGGAQAVAALDVRDGVGAGRGSDRGAGERLRHRGQATGRRHRGDRRPRGTERARDRRGRLRRSGARGSGPDRAGRARSASPDVPHHDGSRRRREGRCGVGRRA